MEKIQNYSVVAIVVLMEGHWGFGFSGFVNFYFRGFCLFVCFSVRFYFGFDRFFSLRLFGLVEFLE